MPKLLTYCGLPVAIIEMLPNSRIDGPELCERISPDEGMADIEEITDDEAMALRVPQGQLDPSDFFGMPEFDENQG